MEIGQLVIIKTHLLPMLQFPKSMTNPMIVQTLMEIMLASTMVS